MKGCAMRNIVLRFLIGLSPLMLLAQPLFAEGEKKAPAGGSMLGNPMIMMMLFMFVIIYFLMIRPEQKKQKTRQKMLSELKKGDKVLTAAGMIGVVGNVKDSTVMVRIADSTTVEFSKNAITAVLTGDNAEKTETGEKK
jgi:preprotein translocase subunit YajC